MSLLATELNTEMASCLRMAALSPIVQFKYLNNDYFFFFTFFYFTCLVYFLGTNLFSNHVSELQPNAVSNFACSDATFER